MGKHMSLFATAVFQFQVNDPSVLLIRNNQTMSFFFQTPVVNHANSENSTCISNKILFR